MAGTTGLEPATSAVTGQRSNQLSYAPCVGGLQVWQLRLQVACRNFWGAREFERPSTNFPEDAPNPAVGALRDHRRGPWKRVPVVFKALYDRSRRGRRLL